MTDLENVTSQLMATQQLYNELTQNYLHARTRIIMLEQIHNKTIAEQKLYKDNHEVPQDTLAEVV